MKKIFVLAWLPWAVYGGGVSLKSLVAHAEHNGANQVKILGVKAVNQEIEAARSGYAPTVDVGLSLRGTSPVTRQSPGKVGTAFVKVGMNLFDGGRRDAQIDVKRYESQAATYERQAFARSTALNVIRQYFTLKKIRANLSALYQRDKELAAQIDRIEKLQKAGMATVPMVDRLRSAYEENRYTIENTQLALRSSQEGLKLLSGMEARHLKRNYLVEPRKVSFHPLGSIRAMQAKARAIGRSVDAIQAAYSPQVNLNYAYSRMEYSDLAVGVPPGSMPDHQSALQLSAGMRLFDGGAIAHQSEAVRCRKLALQAQVLHALKEQKMNFRLARKRLQTTRAQIRSARSALKAARSNYKAVRKQYEAGVVDNVTYLDALTRMNLAQARHQATRYEYEINKAVYYFYSGHDPKRYIR
jgi:outer membrane protein TolC